MKESAKRKAARNLLHRAGYRAGGHVKETVRKGIAEHEEHDHKGEPKTKLKLKDGGKAEGEKSRHRADKLARGGKAKGHGKVVVNVINAHHPAQAVPKPVPVPVPAGGAGGPPVPPGGPAGAPMPPPSPMNKGGRAKADDQRDEKGGMPEGHFKRGGKVKGYPIKDGSGGGEGRKQKAKAYGA